MWAGAVTEPLLVASHLCQRRLRCRGRAWSAIACAPPGLRARAMTVGALLMGGGLVLGLLHGAAPPRRNGAVRPSRAHAGVRPPTRSRTGRVPLRLLPGYRWPRSCPVGPCSARSLGVVEGRRGHARPDARSRSMLALQKRSSSRAGRIIQSPCRNPCLGRFDPDRP